MSPFSEVNLNIRLKNFLHSKAIVSEKRGEKEIIRDI